MKNAIVVGGGLAGLCTAILLARGGHRVVVYERAPVLGGRARSPLVGDVPMNLGAHALYRGGAAERVLRSVGVQPQGFAPPPDAVSLTLHGSVVPAPHSPMSILWSAWLPWPAKAELVKWLGGISRHAKRAEANQSWGEWLAQVKHDEVRRLLSMLARVATYANAEARFSAKAALSQIAAAVSKGVIYPSGGWQSFVDVVAAEAKRVGVEVKVGASVAHVTPDGRRVELDGVTHETDVTVLAVPLAAAVSLTKLPVLQHLQANACASRVATLDVVLKRLPRPERLLAQGLDQPTYFSVHSATEEPVVKVHAHWVLEAEEHGAAKRESLEQWLNLVQPEWRQHVIAERFMPELRVADALPVVGDLRPGIQLGERLFAATEWAQPGLLLDASLAAVESVVAAVANASRVAA